jgi:hypothetical protein
MPLPRALCLKNIPENHQRENLAGAQCEQSERDANIAQSECGTAKLGRIMMLMNGVFCPDPLPITNDEKFTKNSQVTGSLRYSSGTNSVGPSR